MKINKPKISYLEDKDLFEQYKSEEYNNCRFTSNVDDSDNSKLAVIGYVAYILYVISDYIILWLSRQREYYADNFSINVTFKFGKQIARIF